MPELPLSLSLTQTSEKSPHVFVDTSGSPLSVFLEVNPEIPERFRLIRLLRASGADISHNPSEADILLINSETESGLKFLHDWKADSHKTFLRYSWVQSCLRSGRALLEAEDWGGFRVFHTSECVYSDDEGDEGLEDEQNDTRPSTTLKNTSNERASLSTPSKASLSSTNIKLPSPAPSSSDQSAKQLHTPRLVPSRRTFSGRRASNSTSIQSPSFNLDPVATVRSSPKAATGISTQPTPIRRNSTPTTRKRTLSNPQPSQQNSASPPATLPQAANVPTLVPTLSQVPEPSVSQNTPLFMNYPVSRPPLPGDSMDLFNALNYAFQTQNTTSQVPNAASQTLTQLVETIIAVAQVQGMDTAIIQNYLATLPMATSVNQPSPLPHIPDPPLRPLGELPGPSVPSSSLADVGKNQATTFTPRSLVSSESTSPAKRKRQSPEPSLPPKRITSNPRQDPSGVPLKPPQSGMDVFVTKNGRPILVFVQIDIRGRHEIVHLIKKNGGKITADIPKATFVILNPRSVSYADLRQEADNSERTVVQTSFVTESVKQGHLLDPNGFLLGASSAPRKLNLGARRIRDRPSPESDRVTSEVQAHDAIVHSSPSIPVRQRSITPDPPAAVRSKKGYKFTPAEMTYTWALVHRLITKDRMATKLIVAEALHEKMPHHSVSSWMSTITRHSEMYEAVRTTALDFSPAPEEHPPTSQQLQGTNHVLNGTGHAEMNEGGRGTEKLEGVQVGASLIVAEAESKHHEELQPPLEGDVQIEHDAYAQDFEALGWVPDIHGC
ncbi:hypothetical protein F5148DRAFT_1279420 [Russula earlei]|uniref:Uncharacterized protein n=1 Tax=Russula earlei TaxID=71964 RepID=A0ACC0UMY6_9AGAM|nr:hypothetical protein F5148DRAFT_1279420 [Russula earlei]